jgi:hypothetical protein
MAARPAVAARGPNVATRMAHDREDRGARRAESRQWGRSGPSRFGSSRWSAWPKPRAFRGEAALAGTALAC